MNTTVRDLRVGDMWWSPARRWEVITRIDDADGATMTTRVWTTTTGEAAWRLHSSDGARRIHASEHTERVGVRIDISPGRTSPILVSIDRPGTWSVRGHLLASARYRGTGHGWEIHDNPTGGNTVFRIVDTKSKAITAIKQIAKAHAKALSLPYLGVQGGA